MRKKIFFIILFQSIAGTVCFSQNWLLSGNSGTNPTTHFLGTADKQALVFKTSKIERLRILSTGNIGIGTSSPMQKMDINGNMNLRAGYAIYIDNHKLISSDFATFNLVVGGRSGLSLTGKSNTAIGNNALYTLTTGNYNTAVGTAALFSNNSDNNTATGFSALSSNSSGYSLTATGAFALAGNTTGALSTALGNYALNANTTGNNNTAVGWSALYSNTIGNNNVAMGNQAMYNNNLGSDNTAYGNKALYTNTYGIQNVAIGNGALSATVSSNNVAIGYNAGAVFNVGNNNTFVGSNAGTIYNGIYNSTAIGSNVAIAVSNQVKIGNSYVTSIGGWANWTNMSDGRIKRNIKEDVPGLAFINKLKPITYTLDLDAAERMMNMPADKSNAGKPTTALSQSEQMARQEKQKVVYTGFIAQDVEKAAKELHYDFSGVDAAKSEKALYGLRYTDFIMPIVKALQELSKLNDSTTEVVRRLQDEMDAQSKEIALLHSMLKGKQKDTYYGMSPGAASLDQNRPNPVKNRTTIGYSLPELYGSAQLVLTDNAGRKIKSVALGHGGTIELTTDGFINGVYNYSLMIDGKIVATKRLTVLK
ncbi:MAG: tail fiber domain-containing protein [Agriterribacter sp.]